MFLRGSDREAGMRGSLEGAVNAISPMMATPTRGVLQLLRALVPQADAPNVPAPQVGQVLPNNCKYFCLGACGSVLPDPAQIVGQSVASLCLL